MKRFFPVLVAVMAGCGTGSHVQGVPPELRVYRPAVPALGDRHGSSSLEGIAPGTWVRYRLVRDGNEDIVTLGVVKAEPDALWIEVVEEGDPRKASQRRIAFDGTVTKARYREIPAAGAPSEIADQPVSPVPDGVAPRGPPVRETTAKKSVKVGSKTAEATVFQRLYRDESVGREFEEEQAWSADVPPLFEDLEVSGKPAGLVVRKSPAGTVELLDWGTGYSPVIP